MAAAASASSSAAAHMKYAEFGLLSLFRERAKQHGLPLLIIDVNAPVNQLLTVTDAKDVFLSDLPSPLCSEWIAVALVNRDSSSHLSSKQAVFWGAHRIMPLLLQIDPAARSFPVDASFSLCRSDCFLQIEHLRCSPHRVFLPSHIKAPTRAYDLDHAHALVKARLAQYASPNAGCFITTKQEAEDDTMGFLLLAATVVSLHRTVRDAIKTWIGGEMAIHLHRLKHGPVSPNPFVTEWEKVSYLFQTQRLFPPSSAQYVPHLIFPFGPGMVQVHSPPLALAWDGMRVYEQHLRTCLSGHPFLQALLAEENVQKTILPVIGPLVRAICVRVFKKKEEVKAARITAGSPPVQDIEELRVVMPDCMRAFAARAFDGKGNHLEHMERLAFYRATLQMGIPVDVLTHSVMRNFQSSSSDSRKAPEHEQAIRAIHKTFREDKTTDYTSCTTMQNMGLCGHMKGSNKDKARVECYKHQTRLLDGKPDESIPHKNKETGEVMLTKDGKVQYTWFSSPLNFMQRVKSLRVKRGLAATGPLAPVFHRPAAASPRITVAMDES